MATDVYKFFQRRSKVFWGGAFCCFMVGKYDPVDRFHMRPYSIFVYSDGRQTSFLDRGSKEKDATVILYFHDTGGSRFEPELFGTRKLLPSKMLRSAGMRLISLERDGIGESRTRPFHEKEFTVGTIARDIEEFCRGSNISNFHAIGYGNGASYALAAGRLGKCQSVTMIGPVKPYASQESMDNAPFSVRLKQSALYWPFYRSNPLTIWLLKFPLILLFKFPRIYFSFWERFGFGPGSPDSALLSGLVKDKYQSEFIANHKECFRQSVVPFMEDVWLTRYQHWELDFDQIHCPVKILRGGRDTQCTAQWCQWLADKVENSKLIEYADDGHLSLPVNHFVDIVLDIAKESNEALMQEVVKQQL